MKSKSRHARRWTNRLSSRTVTALGLSALLGVNGAPVVRAQPTDIPLNDAVRFLEQATFGPIFASPGDPNYSVSVARVQELGFEAWLNEQFNKPVWYPDNPDNPSVGTNYAQPGDPQTCYDPGGGMCWTPPARPANCTNNGGSTCQRDNYTAYLLQQQFFVNALTGQDQLRQRVAWALSQIDVVSQAPASAASWMIPYLGVFDRDAFGNFRQLLYDITVNPAMGEWLNMRGNNKNNVNENYAREILQLFSVGLNKLNDDGTLRDGSPTPTYDQDVITAFARVFTGWDLDAQLQPGNIANYRDPMIVVESRHDTNPKTLLDGQVLSGGDDARTELGAALDIIFNHSNCGPFIGKNLIQHLVTSNPSPDYVRRVTTAFNTGTYGGPTGTAFGLGRRGDMQAVIAAILLDPEARNAPSDPNSGHLREPVLYITNTLRALGIDPNGTTTDFVLGDSFLPPNFGAGNPARNLTMDQDVFRSPTVFNYYAPDNQVAGTDCGGGEPCLGPEFAIQSTNTAISRINFMRDVAFHLMPVSNPITYRPMGTWIDTTPFEPEAVGDASALLDDLNTRLMAGAMSAGLRSVVFDAVNAIPESDLAMRVREAIYVIASSAEYQVER